MSDRVLTSALVVDENVAVALTTVEGIEIATVGEDWPSASGPFTLTAEHIASVIASQDDPAIKSPRVKLGHTSSLTPDDPTDPFSGMPVFGKFVNLRTDESGGTLIGDIAGIPKWAAEVLPYAWPSRSGEWWRDFDNFGTAKKQYPMVLTAVALLGVELPGITTIEDLPALFTAEGPEGVTVVVDGAKIRASSKGDTIKTTRTVKTGSAVITSVDSYDVRKSFFTDFATEESGRYWWWPIETFINPLAVICDDEEGNLYFVTYSVGEDDAISWGDPEQVKHQYVAAEGGKVLANIQQQPVMKFATAADARPPDRQRRKTTQTKEASPVKPEIIQQVRKLHGLTEEQLPDDADDATLEQALSGLPEPEPEPEPEPAPEPEPVPTSKLNLPAGVSAIDTETLTQMQTDLARLTKKDKESEMTKRVTEVEKAISDRKIPPSRKEHYTALMERDPEGTRELFSKLEAGAVPGPETGTSEDVTASRMSAGGTGLIPELNRERSAA
jgi:hypothetical protein